MLLAYEEVLHGSFKYFALVTCAVFTEEKSNKVLLFWDPRILVSLTLVLRSFFHCSCSFFILHEDMYPGVAAYSLLGFSCREIEWWGRRVPSGQPIPGSRDQAGSHGWPGRSCEPPADVLSRVRSSLFMMLSPYPRGTKRKSF